MIEIEEDIEKAPKECTIPTNYEWRHRFPTKEIADKYIASQGLLDKTSYRCINCQSWHLADIQITSNSRFATIQWMYDTIDELVGAYCYTCKKNLDLLTPVIRSYDKVNSRSYIRFHATNIYCIPVDVFLQIRHGQGT